MKKKEIILLLILLFCVIMILISCHSKSTVVKEPIYTSSNIDTPHVTIDTVKAIRMTHLTSSNLYDIHCKMCHGVHGQGDGVKARTSRGVICPYDLSKVTKPDKEVYYIVLNGEQKMPNQYELDTTDVWVIVIYIKKFKEIK